VDVQKIAQKRFDELAAPTRLPIAHLLWCELEWWAAGNESVIGAVVLDLADRDYSWIMLGKSRDSGYRPLDLGHSKRDQASAQRELHEAMATANVPSAGLPDAAFAAADEAMLGEGAAALGTTVDEVIARAREVFDAWGKPR
jgi:hypothetical protein